MQARYHDPVIDRFLSIDPDGEFAILPLAGFGAVVGFITGTTSAAVNRGDFNAVVVAAGAGAIVGGVAGLTAGTVTAGQRCQSAGSRPLV